MKHPPDGDFARRLLAWHEVHGRHDLPWSGRDPYRIWLAEVMLQQTQVATVRHYYSRFIARFPTLAALAAAEEAEVLALWSGLGYYARARHLLACARQVMHAHGGEFPRDPASLAALPGIGRSTAHAIAAFCFAVRVPILDGNVKRVLCRHAGIDGWPGTRAIERRLWQLAASLLPASAQMAAYTQAQMDLGALVCTPRCPACACCPLAGDCVAWQQGRVAELPTARPRQSVPEVERVLLLIRYDGRLWLERRPPAGLWGGLLAPPEVPPDATPQTVAARLGWRIVALRPLAALQHRLTHRLLRLHPVLATVKPLPGVTDAVSIGLTFAEALAGGLPAPIRRLIENLATSAENAG